MSGVGAASEPAWGRAADEIPRIQAKFAPDRRVPGRLTSLTPAGKVLPLRRSLTLAAFSLALTLALTGCSLLRLPGDPAPQQTGSAPAQTANAPAPTTAADGTTSNPVGGEDVDIDLNDETPAIASVSAAYSGEERLDTVSVDLVRLERRDKLLYGVFRLTTTGTSSEELSLHEILGASWAPSLIDATGLREYQSIQEIASNSSTTEAMVDQPMYIHAGWAYPEGATTVDILLSEGLPPLTGITVP
ncbi:MAG: hypothetical protein ACK5LN_09275 [Propioniciclava sp.]